MACLDIASHLTHIQVSSTMAGSRHSLVGETLRGLACIHCTLHSSMLDDMRKKVTISRLPGEHLRRERSALAAIYISVTVSSLSGWIRVSWQLILAAKVVRPF